MPEYSDVYVISDRRDNATICEFLDRFLVRREETADAYEYPQYADDPEVVFITACEAIAWCSEDSTREYVIYWRAIDEAIPEHAMVFFLSDGNVIYGLSTNAANPTKARQLLADLKALLGSQWGYIAHEASPSAANLGEFKAQAEAHGFG